MKIIQIISNLGNGGAEKLVIELSNELVLSNEVTLVSFRNVDENMIFPKLLSKQVKLIQLGKKKGGSLKLYFQLFKIFIKEKPNIVHFHLNSTFKYVFPFIYLFFNTKFIYTIHCNITKGHRKVFNLINKYIKNLKRLNYICISPTILDEFNEAFPKISFKMVENGLKLYQKKHELIENNLLKKFQKSSLYDYVFIAVGRINIQKNYILLFQVIENFPQIKVNIIADLKTADNAYYKELCQIKPKNVEFIGKSDKVIQLMKLSDAFIMTSSFEGMPIAALEAISTGLPIITTPCGGMVDLIQNEKNGFVSNDFSVEEFKNIIFKFINLTENEKENIKQNNIKKIEENYSISKCANEYMKIYS